MDSEEGKRRRRAAALRSPRRHFQYVYSSLYSACNVSTLQLSERVSSTSPSPVNTLRVLLARPSSHHLASPARIRCQNVSCCRQAFQRASQGRHLPPLRSVATNSRLLRRGFERDRSRQRGTGRTGGKGDGFTRVTTDGAGTPDQPIRRTRRRTHFEGLAGRDGRTLR